MKSSIVMIDIKQSTGMEMNRLLRINLLVILIKGNIHMHDAYMSQYIDQCIQCMLINVQCFKNKSIFIIFANHERN